MRQPSARFPSWHNRVADHASAPRPVDGPLAPAELRDEAPAADGVRHNLVAFYRDRIAAGWPSSNARLVAAEDALFDRIDGDDEAA